MYWLGFAQDSLTALKKQNVGTESVSANYYKHRHEIGVPEADRVIANIFEEDPRRAFIAFKYLEDMRKNLIEVYKVLREGGRYIIVVGNNRIRGQLFENWKYLMPIAENIGFAVETYFGSEIIKHFIKVPRGERINTDWILVLKK
jgi:SAM-dependent methyltransferase